MIPPDPLYPFSFGEAGNGEGVRPVYLLTGSYEGGYVNS